MREPALLDYRPEGVLGRLNPYRTLANQERHLFTNAPVMLTNVAGRDADFRLRTPKGSNFHKKLYIIRAVTSSLRQIESGA